MSGDRTPSPASVLDPVDRSSEILFGLIMALTFTTTFEVAMAGKADVRAMLVGALGCNLAWGLVDGVMFVVLRAVEKQRFRSKVRALQSASDADAPRILGEELPEGWELLLDEDDRRRIIDRARTLAPQPGIGVTAADLKGGLAVLLLVVLATVPVAVPFVLFQDLYLAARVSDAVGILMLFVVGTRLGRYAGHRPLLVGLVMVAIGVALSAIAIRLGG